MAVKKKRCEFRIMAPEAREVFLSGTFNGWSETLDPMKRDEKGIWKKVKMLTPGRYEYKFIVDGMWILDPHCGETVANEHGTGNSCIYTA